MKKFKCRTFSNDTLTLDYGKEHLLITTEFESGKKLSICLNDQDIDQMIKYLLYIKGVRL